MKEIKSTTIVSDGEAEEQAQTVATGQESSVEISENAKGEPKVTVKVYDADIEDAAALAVLYYNQVRARLQVAQQMKEA